MFSSVMLDAACVVYELNRGAPHDHLICVHCKRVFDFADATLAGRRQAVAHRYGFRIEHYS
ncbi:transcriptional repressor, partial [Paraburkholderia sediminicola]